MEPVVTVVTMVAEATVVASVAPAVVTSTVVTAAMVAVAPAPPAMSSAAAVPTAGPGERHRRRQHEAHDEGGAERRDEPAPSHGASVTRDPARVKPVTSTRSRTSPSHTTRRRIATRSPG
jgi:hypothetical protein